MLPETKFLSRYFGLTGARILLGLAFLACIMLIIGSIFLVGSFVDLLKKS
jgi:hypothetical protein